MHDDTSTVDVDFCHRGNRPTRVATGGGHSLMKRRKPTSPAALPHDLRYTVHRPTVQALPPSTPRPRKKIGHSIKYRSPSGGDSGVFAPIPRRVAIFFGVGGRAGWRK